MIHPDGNRTNGSTGVVHEPAPPADTNSTSVLETPTVQSTDVATRAKLRAANQVREDAA